MNKKGNLYKTAFVKNINDDTTFNKLSELQTLLKKESALKELFIKAGIETQKNIEEQCVDIYEKKMEVLNILQKLKLNSEEELNDEDDSNNSPNKSSNSTFENIEALKNNVLIKDNYGYLQVLNTYIPNLLNYLWEDPKLVANLLMVAEKNDTEKYLAPLICNNFYENILSSNYIEDPLMYIIYLLLENEINNINNLKDTSSFLEKTVCSFLFKQLIEKKDVKDFFKIILHNLLEDIGTNQFNFDIKEIEQNQIKKRKTVNKVVFEKGLKKNETFKNEKHKSEHVKIPQNNTFLNTKTFSSSSISKIDDANQVFIDNENYQVFSAKYLVTTSFEELNQKIKEEKNNYMKDYYSYILSNAENKNSYSQENFADLISESKNPQTILYLYQQDFIKTTEFIDKLFQNLNDNYRIVPYAIKCICKIIIKLVEKKFPDSNIIEKDLLISKFFFNILLIPILLKPDINALINDYIISYNIKQNTNLISKIINQFVSFRLYQNEAMTKGGNYTPFNIYFMENISHVFRFYEKIIKVKLPHFIDEFINEDVSVEDYNFNYFKENPSEVVFHKSMLLNIDEFNAIYKTLLNNKDKLFNVPKEEKKGGILNKLFKGNKDKDKEKDKNNNKNDNNIKVNTEFEKRKKKILMAIDKISSSDNLDILHDLLKHKEYTIEKKEKEKEKSKKKKPSYYEIKKQNIQYFHITELLFSDKYKEIFSLQQKNPYFNIKEIKEINDKESKNKNNVIKAKNFLSSILYNYRILVKSDFVEGTTSDTQDILKELKLFMKSSNFVIDGNIPSEWYVSALIDCLKKLPFEYRENDYKKLYDELKVELLDSIKQFNFENMSIFIDKMKYAKRNKTYFNKTKEIYMDIELNNIANNIIMKEPINVSLYFKFNDKKREFNVFEETVKEKQLDFLDSFTFKDNSEKGKICKTIEQFTKNFPNLIKRVSLEGQVIDENDIGILELQKEIELPKKLKIFFNIVSDHLKNIVKNENELHTMNNKIYDYVMSKIYHRIYPKEKHIFDDQILQKVCKLSWIEPQNIIKGKTQFNFDLIMPDINKYFNLIRNEKSPRKKLINLDNIFSSINRLLIFNGATKVGVDDQIPLLTYCFIKTRPIMIYTDCKFMQLYIGDKKNKGEDNQLTQMITICDFINASKAQSFFNVDEEEFNRKSQDSFAEYMDNYLE